MIEGRDAGLGVAMSGNTLIRFFTREQEARAVCELSEQFRIHRFRGRIYSVPAAGLNWLEQAGIPYQEATDEEVEAAIGSVRNPAAAAVQ